MELNENYINQIVQTVMKNLEGAPTTSEKQ